MKYLNFEVCITPGDREELRRQISKALNTTLEENDHERYDRDEVWDAYMLGMVVQFHTYHEDDYFRLTGFSDYWFHDDEGPSELVDISEEIMVLLNNQHPEKGWYIARSGESYIRQFFTTGSWVLLSNTPFRDKTPGDFYPAKPDSRNEMAGVSRSVIGYENVIGLLQKAMQDAIWEKDCSDLVLHDWQVKRVALVFAEAAKELISCRKSVSEGFSILFLGEVVNIDLRNKAKTDVVIHNYIRIYELAEACFNDRRPLYLNVN